MRLQEIFLVETTEEDRAIVSVASALNSYIQKYEGEDAGGDFYDGDEDPDDTIHDEMKVIGSIRELVGDSPIPEFNGISIILQSDYGIRLRKKKENDEKGVSAPTSTVMGMWYPSARSIVLNKDYIGYNNLRTVISHELRHALDDIKSDFKANKSGGKYSIPRKKEHRTNDTIKYLAEPAEINARFLQVLDVMVRAITNTSINLSTRDGRDKIINHFYKLLANERISELFPEKEKSRDYKRLIKRGVDFIDKEIAYVRSQSK